MKGVGVMKNLYIMLNKLKKIYITPGYIINQIAYA